MKMLCAVMVSSLAMLLLARLEVVAGPHVSAGVHPLHFGGHLHPLHHHFRLVRHHRVIAPLYGYGVYDVPAYPSDDAVTYSTPEPAMVPAAEPPPAGCQRSKETVPSENGETQVTILRC